MSYDATLLNKAAERVITEGEGYYNVRTNVNIRVNNTWIKPHRLDYLHLARDYGSAMGDVRQIECLMLLGDYTYDLVPHRDNLVIDITEIPLMEGSSSRNWDRRAGTKRYKAILDMTKTDNTVLTNKTAAMSDKRQMNMMGMKSVVFTLIDEISYKLMMTSCGTTLRQMNSLDMLVWLHEYYFKKLFVGSSVRVEATNIWRQDFNPDVQHQVAFPDGLLLKDVPRFLQNDECGVYPTGLGRYYQDNQFYVYPLFDYTRYKKHSRVLNIINMPNERFQGSEKTFLVTPKSVTILATGKVKGEDLTTGNRIQEGNGVRFGNASTLMNQGITKGNRLLVDRATNLYEVAGDPLADGLNNMRWADERFSSNPYRHYTTMAQQQGQSITIQWFRGNVDLLEPGMPTRYQVLDGDTVRTYYGTLLGVNDNRIPVDPGNLTSKYDGIASLTLHLVRHTETQNTAPT